MSAHRKTCRPVALLLAPFALILAVMTGRPAHTTAQTAASPHHSGLTVLQSDSNGITFELVQPPLERFPARLGGSAFERLRLPGYTSSGAPGQPELPQNGLLIALPPGAQPVLELLASEHQTIHSVSVAPVARQELVGYDAADPAAIPDFREVILSEPLIYEQAARFPETVAELGAEARIRDQRVVPVYVRPVQVNPAERTLHLHTRLRIRVRFDYSTSGPASLAPARPDSPVWERILSANLLNYNEARAWRQAPQGDVSDQRSRCLDDNAYRIAVNETGMYRIEHGVLPGFPASVSSASIRMCHMDEEIDIHLLDGGDGSFSGSDSLIFYGEAIKTQETETNIYWLTHSGTAGSRMANGSESGSGTTPQDYAFTIHLEEDESYQPRFPMSDANDHWYFNCIAFNSSNCPQTLSLDFEVHDVTSADVLVRAEVWGWNSYEEHHYEVLLNGDVISSDNFTASAIAGPPDVYSDTITGDKLADHTTNTITIRALNSGDCGYGPCANVMAVNWIEVTPRRDYVARNGRIAFTQALSGTWRYSIKEVSLAPYIYEVTDPYHPLRVTNSTMSSSALTFTRNDAQPGTAYELATVSAMLSPANISKVSPSDLADKSNQADYIIITDPGLESALNELRTRRQSQGLLVKTVYVQNIFDEFSYGFYDTEAIRRFLEYAYSFWEGPASDTNRPSYVLLAGDGSYDHRNVLGLNGSFGNAVPVYLVSAIDQYYGETAADNRYVAFGDEDTLADMLLGRLPAESTEELANMVEKIIDYETAAPQGWMGRHYLMADNYYKPPGCSRDAAGDFHTTVDEFLRDYLPESQLYSRTDHAPIDCYPEPRPDYYADTAEMENRFLQSYNQGNQIVVYIGHSASTQWGDQFVDLDTVDALSNGSKTPIMLPMTCLAGTYHRPGQTSLSEAFLKEENGGSVAEFTPTGLQVQTGHNSLLHGFYEAVFEQNASTLGEAVMGGKTRLKLEDPGAAYQDLQDTFMLLGDPAMRFNIWYVESQLYTPLLSVP